MARKKTKPKTVQGRAAGPQKGQHPKVRVNGVDASARSKSSLMQDVFPKKSGMHTALGRRACDLYSNPLASGPPVFASPTAEVSLAASSVGHASSHPIHAGRYTQASYELEIAAGTAGMGYIMCVPYLSANAGSGDLIYTNGAYTGNTVVGTVATTGVTQTALCKDVLLNVDCSFKLVAARLTLSANFVAAAARSGAIAAVRAPVKLVNGNTFAGITQTPFSEIYPSTVFDEQDQIMVRAAPTTNSVRVTATHVGNPLTYSNTKECFGFVFTGLTAAATLSIRVEYAVFAWGYGIPPTITPCISQAAIDCVATCIANVTSEQVGTTQGNNSSTIKRLLGEAEHHTLLSMPSPVVSGLWNFIKDAATTYGPSLLKALF